MKSGGTMTGNIASQAVYPKTANSYNCGTTSNMWNSVCSRLFYVVGSDTGTYAQVYPSTLGTTSEVGTAWMFLGNNIASGTAKNARGYLRIYGSSSGYTNIQTGNNTTSNITLTLPSKTGTIPTVSLSGTTLTITT